jgi:HlyD family secretion protein
VPDKNWAPHFSKMNSKVIFPAEIANLTTEGHFNRHYNNSKIIYLMTLLAISIGFISLFFIRVDVSVEGTGILTPSAERNVVKAPVAGRIDKVYFKLNQPVAAGDILFTVQTNVIDEQSGYLMRKSSDLQQRINDLSALVTQKNNFNTQLSLRTSIYRQQQNLYIQQLKEADLALENALVSFNRNRQLHEKRVLSDAEFEKFVYEKDRATSKRKLVQEQQISQWQNDLANLKTELSEIHSQRDKYKQELDFYTVRAPIKGSIQQFSGLLSGNFVSAGETVAEISPDSGLIATVNILPKDIGLISLNQPVRFQIDAFNYNEWGVAHGTVFDISRDVYLDENQSPYFQVKCSLKENALRSNNGYEGTLKKGLGFQARFMVAKRSLFQLLYDKVDDWLDPRQNKPKMLLRK